MKTIAFVVNASKPAAKALSLELVALARVAGHRVRVTERSPLPRSFLRGAATCVVIGGDGTLLAASHEAARAGVPVIGVNQGTLGFLTTFSPDEARQELPALLAGEAEVSERSLLACSVDGGPCGLALNEIVIKDQGNVRILKLDVYADGEFVTEYFCDGLLVSSPTGSTAYNLSAGGPIIHPGAAVLAMTPICAHTLSNRTVVFSEKVRLRVVNRTGGGKVLVALDGHRNLFATHAASVDVSLAEARLRLLQKRGYSHFAVARSKLGWSGAVASQRC